MTDGDTVKREGLCVTGVVGLCWALVRGHVFMRELHMLVGLVSACA